MRRSAGLLITACALGASAFVIPDSIIASIDSDDSSTPFQIQPLINHKSRTIQLSCPSCKSDAEYESINPLSAIQEDESSLLLEFSISDDGERLLLNDEAIYPLHYSLGADVLHRLHLPQLSWPSPQHVDGIELREMEVTGSMISVDEPTAAEDGALVVPLTFAITEVEHKPVIVDGVSVELVENADGELSIVGLTSIPNPSHLSTAWQPYDDDILPLSPPSGKFDLHDIPPPPHHPHHFLTKECSVFCRLKTAFESRFGSPKHGKGAECELNKGKNGLSSHIRPHFLRPLPDGQPRRHHGRPHHVRPHHHHHHHRHHHNRYRLLQAFTRGVAAILIPTLAGVAVGMAVSMFGLCVGRCIGFTWQRLVRGGRRGHASSLVEEGDFDKEFTEPPPVYEEAPAYEEVIAEVK